MAIVKMSKLRLLGLKNSKQKYYCIAADKTVELKKRRILIFWQTVQIPTIPKT